MTARAVPTRLRARAADAVQRFLNRHGYELRAHPPPPREESLRRVRLMAAERITTVLDVGANVGQYAHELRAAGYGGRIVSFEPLSEAHAALAAAAAADPRWETRRLALSDRNGSGEINVAGNSYSSSLLPMGERHLASAPQSAYVGRERVELARLDTIWEEVVPAGERVWLKLDVQGHEPAVLSGAGARLAEVRAVQAELALVSLYEGDLPWRTVIDELEREGFELAGLEPGFEDPESGRMLQADGIFIRRPAA